MALYLKPEARVGAQEALREFHEAVSHAQYELTAAITTARELGLTWDEVGQALGMTKAGASQLHKRSAHLARPEVLHEGEQFGAGSEFDRLARKLGATGGKPRYEVRRIVSGRPGVTRVVRTTVSRHRLRRAAEERADQLGGQSMGSEVWVVRPDGTEEKLPIRPEGRRALDDHEAEAGEGWVPLEEEAPW